jgi:hypothetical protein
MLNNKSRRVLFSALFTVTVTAFLWPRSTFWEWVSPDPVPSGLDCVGLADVAVVCFLSGGTVYSIEERR